MDTKYIKCKYCSGLYNYYDKHVINCANNYDETNGILFCYSCNGTNKQYSKTQQQKRDKARCLECVTNNTMHKYAPYLHLYQPMSKVELMNINAQLYYCVEDLNLSKMRELLEQGADPNYCRQDLFFDDNENEWIYWYNKDGTEKGEIDYYQPITPLNLCVFLFSNCLFEKKDQYNIILMAKILIQFGAQTFNAIKYFESRYRSCDKEIYNLFVANWS